MIVTTSGALFFYVLASIDFSFHSWCWWWGQFSSTNHTRRLGAGPGAEEKLRRCRKTKAKRRRTSWIPPRRPPRKSRTSSPPASRRVSVGYPKNKAHLILIEKLELLEKSRSDLRRFRRHFGPELRRYRCSRAANQAKRVE